ncbi:DUF3467 domain-containing protein [Candidatus Woesearchaeota archaeon]|nr:DUF3467 domain-containing protein [Candidatus Woesearchaeota archaeon]
MAKEENKHKVELNVRIKDSDQFFAQETTINYNPVEFVIDFKCVTPIQEFNQNSVLMRHNIVMMTPFHVKSFLEALTRLVTDYEKKFGTIKRPAELEKAEKIMKKQEKENVTTTNPENYFG